MGRTGVLDCRVYFLQVDSARTLVAGIKRRLAVVVWP